MQSLYAFHCSSEKSINLSEKELFFSIQKSYDLYHLLLDLMVEIKKHAKYRIDKNKEKKIPTKEDLSPNTKFIDNEIILKLEANESLLKYTEHNKLNWVNNPEFIKRTFQQITETDYYNEYMNIDEQSLKEDRKLIEFIYTDIIAQSDELYALLEEQSIYWNDDVEFVISMILKTIKKFKISTTESKALLPLFKDEEDREYTKKLFRKAIIETTELKTIITEHLRNWDIDRVAFIDVLIMELAICEFMYFPSIPTKVTLNEYIELSRYYSTQKSRTFINGILDKILKSLKKDGKIEKAGRGLIGENK